MHGVPLEKVMFWWIVVLLYKPATQDSRRTARTRRNTPASDQGDMSRELNRLQKQQRVDLCSRLKGSIFNQVFA
jgi:hypothetical protein